MHRIFLICGWAFVASCALHAEVDAGPTMPEVSVEMGTVSQYLWRGFVVNNSPSLQPSITTAYRGFSVNLWSNISRTALQNQAWTESDITFDYSRRIGKSTLSGGYTDYHFVDTPGPEGNRSSEVYVGVSLDVPLNPSVRVYRDFELGRGYYYSASIMRPVRFPHGIRGDTTLAVGLNQHQFQRQTTISNIESTTSAQIVNRERFTLAAFVTVMSGHRDLFGTHAAFGLRAIMHR